MKFKVLEKNLEYNSTFIINFNVFGHQPVVQNGSNLFKLIFINMKLRIS